MSRSPPGLSSGFIFRLASISQALEYEEDRNIYRQNRPDKVKAKLERSWRKKLCQSLQTPLQVWPAIGS
jgi:hypothetical protein